MSQDRNPLDSISSQALFGPAGRESKFSAKPGMSQASLWAQPGVSQTQNPLDSILNEILFAPAGRELSPFLAQPCVSQSSSKSRRAPKPAELDVSQVLVGTAGRESSRKSD